MFTGYKIEDENTIVLHLDPNLHEFSSELDIQNNGKKRHLNESIKAYLQEKVPNFSPKMVKVVMGTLVVATVALGGGQTLKTEAASNDTKVVQVSNTHTVVNGETLYGIAKKYNLSVTELKQLNNLTSDMIYVGQTLKINGDATPSNIATHTVKSGETLYSIANKYGMSVDELKQLNNMTTNLIYVNQSLKVRAAAEQPNQPVQESSYVVKAGDTLYGISKKFNLSVAQLKSINNLQSDVLSIGQTLKITGQETKKEAPTQNNEQVMAALIKDSYNYIGVPYKWGGTTPSGFDCSGFVAFMFSQHGIDIPRLTSGDYYKMGTTVSKNNLKEGDLVFFAVNNPNTISHVGFYVGNNKFISATSSSGIAVVSLDNVYWSKYYVGAKRVV